MDKSNRSCAVPDVCVCLAIRCSLNNQIWELSAKVTPAGGALRTVDRTGLSHTVRRPNNGDHSRTGRLTSWLSTERSVSDVKCAGVLESVQVHSLEGLREDSRQEL
jgi:hypothetical protein